MEAETMKESAETERVCEICGSKEYIIGVASSYLGPISLMQCAVCAGMGAQPVWLVKSMVELNGGIDAFDPRLDLIIYDPAMDCYVNYRSGRPIRIQTQGGDNFLFKEELLTKWRKTTMPVPGEGGDDA